MVFFSSRRRHTRFDCDWSSDVCSSDLWVLVDPLFAFMLYWRTLSKIELSPRAYLRALWPALSGSALMAAAVVAGGGFSGSGGAAGPRFGAPIGAGGLAYRVAPVGMHPGRVEAVCALGP